MTGETRFQSLGSAIDPAREVSRALPWVHAAGQPYIDWLLGGRRAGLRMVAEWMRRPSSEVFVGRAVVLVDDRRQLGGFIAISGADLARCRMQDAVAAAAGTPPEGRSALLGRFRLARLLFAEVPPDHLYLSRMGVLASAQGRGHGKAIVREHLRRGIQHGVRQFSLDVWSGNQTAIELYRSIGFTEDQRHHVDEADMTYIRMTLEVSASFAGDLTAEQ